MGQGRTQGSGRSGVSASELAAMGVCERRLVLDHRHGRRWSVAQREAIERGLRLHAAFDEQADAAQAGRRGRCFIATHIFGSTASETEALRRYRDSVLKASSAGCRLIVWYYRLAPRVCGWLVCHPWACTPVRRGLAVLVWYARWRCRRTKFHHGR